MPETFSSFLLNYIACYNKYSGDKMTIFNVFDSTEAYSKNCQMLL